MFIKLSELIDRLSEYLAPRKGLLPLIGLAMIIINFILRLTPVGWLTTTDLFLHLGLIIAILGIMFAWIL